MSTKQQSASPVSDVEQRYAMYDERKRKRMISNRESARRSRMKKQQRLDEMSGQVGKLQNDNNVLSQKINDATQLYLGVANENNVLRAQLGELTDRLRSLNSVLEIVSDVSGLAVDIPTIPDTLLEPWQLPRPIQPITASANMF